MHVLRSKKFSNCPSASTNKLIGLRRVIGRTRRIGRESGEVRGGWRLEGGGEGRREARRGSNKGKREGEARRGREKGKQQGEARRGSEKGKGEGEARRGREKGRRGRGEKRERRIGEERVLCRHLIIITNIQKLHGQVEILKFKFVHVHVF
jgi:hypothetical protein